MFKGLLASANGFTKNILILMTGTGLAQAIPIAFIPVLTRLYTPEDFGVLALFISITSVFSVVATARYELAVMLPDNDEDAISLVLLSWVVCALISAFMLISVFCFGSDFAAFLGNERVYEWLYFVPIAVLSAGTFQTLNYWFNRKGTYKKIATGKVVQSSGAGFQAILEGLLGAVGLVVGRVMGLLSSAFFMLYAFLKNDRGAVRAVKVNTVFSNAKKYKKFPLLSMPGAMLDTAALQVPVFFTNKFFDTHSTGMFSLTFRILNVPMSLFSVALSQVLFQRVVQIQKNNPEQLFGFIVKIFLLLIGAMVPFIAAVYCFGEVLFALVLGEEWRQAGVLAVILAPAVAIRFAVGPLSVVLAMDHNVKLGALWQVIYFVTISISLFLARDLGLEGFFIVFCIHEIVLYLFYLVLILRGAINKPCVA